MVPPQNIDSHPCTLAAALQKIWLDTTIKTWPEEHGSLRGGGTLLLLFLFGIIRQI